MYEASRSKAVAKGAFSASLVCLSLANVLLADVSIGDSERPQPPPSLSSSSTPSRIYEGGRGTRVCGSNALYMLLGLYGIPVDEEQFGATVPVNDDGTSLAELQEAAGALGLEMSVRRCSIEELQKHFRWPFLAHLTMVPPHYCVVIDISDDSVTFLDGTTGELETLRRSWVEAGWSGYVLLPRTSDKISPIVLGASMLNGLVVALLTAQLFRDWRNRPRTVSLRNSDHSSMSTAPSI